MMHECPDRTRLASMWHDILSYAERRDEIFGILTQRLLNRHAEDRIPHPGYVGSRYRCGGLLFLGMNPGPGGDGHGLTEMPHYDRLRQLQAASPEDQARAFERLMQYDAQWYPTIRIMRTIVTPILDGTGLTYESISYFNVLKWRTTNGAGLKPLYEISLERHTLAQLAELKPGMIVVLGVGVAQCLAALSGIPPEVWQSLYHYTSSAWRLRSPARRFGSG